MANNTPIEIAMSTTRLYEALKAEARTSNDEALIRRWNTYAIELGRKLDQRAQERKRGLPASVLLGYGYGGGFRSL